MIGLEEHGRPVLGVVYLPGLDEMVYAAHGLGCWWLPTGSGPGAAPRRARVSAVTSLSESLLLVTSVEYFRRSNRAKYYDRILAAGTTRGWSDCYAHVLVATGRAEVAIDPIMNVWDSAPFLPILAEAGGTFSDWEGNSTIAGGDAVSTNGKVHEAVLQLLRG